jgi:hypothetical protein
VPFSVLRLNGRGRPVGVALDLGHAEQLRTPAAVQLVERRGEVRNAGTADPYSNWAVDHELGEPRLAA